MKKSNKAAAVEWQKEQEESARNESLLEEQTNLLRYAAEKRKSGYPSPETLRSLGKEDVAKKLDEAYALIDQAYRLLVESDATESTD